MPLSVCITFGLGSWSVLEAEPGEKIPAGGERLILVRIGTLPKQSLSWYAPHFSPDGRYLFTQGVQETASRLWSVPDLKPIRTLSREGPVYDSRMSVAVTITSTPTTTLGDGDPRDVTKVWGLPGWKLRATLTGVRARPYGNVMQYGSFRGDGAISADGRYLAAFTWRRVLKPPWYDRQRSGMALWSLPDGQFVKLMPRGPRNSLGYNWQFSPTMPLLISSDYMTPEDLAANPGIKGLVEKERLAPPMKTSLWSVPDGKLIVVLPGARAIGFSPDGRALACFGPKWGVDLWSVPEGKLLFSFSGSEPERLDPYAASKGCGALSAGGKYLAYRDLKATQLWAVSERKLVATIDSAGESSILAQPIRLSFSPDERLLATSLDQSRGLGGWSSSRLWSTRTGRLLATLPKTSGIAFSPDGCTLAATDGFPIGSEVSLWLYGFGQDVDWSADKAATGGNARAEARVSTKASVYAGDKLWLDTTVRNSGDTDLTQLWAKAETGSLQLSRLITFIGRVKPGKTVQRRADVILPVGHKTGKLTGSMVFRAADKKLDMPGAGFEIVIKPLPRPDFVLLAKPRELRLRRGQRLQVPIIVKNQTGAAIADLKVTIGILKGRERVTLSIDILEFGSLSDGKTAEQPVTLQAKADAPAGPVTFELRAGDAEGRVFALQQFALSTKE